MTATLIEIECTPEQTEAFLKISDEFVARAYEQGGDPLCAVIGVKPEGFWITHSEDICIDAVIEVLSEWKQQVGGEPLAFEWADGEFLSWSANAAAAQSESPEGFGGGAAVIWADGEVDRMGTFRWTQDTIAEGQLRRS